MDGVGSSYRGGSDRISSSSYDGSTATMSIPRDSLVQQYPASTSSSGNMGPPPSTSRAAIAASQNGYTSMTGAGFALQGSDHPPSKSSTGGQSHAHRPVSAMPTPTSRSHHQYSSPRQAEPSVLSPINNTAYNDRRASAHPTMSTPTNQSGMMPPSLPTNGSLLDVAMTSGAIQNGIPITSPAALQYFAAHPRRQQVHFGNYLLLQTLGEGEFGKVKLGVHKEWGEEVAVKLIKRDKVGTPDGQLQITGPSKDPSKMSKVEKEIRVLKDVRHPNIVRLYEVIESDRYIGIVLEYASGGELFDHILAHKYLKERDACRLFAQLISGVSYLHHKKIVHRDLKLENLLLDRNRNVIITDFGFANNFENRKDDLMATSCGSPCYAAPELVVQDGLYAGSAVDVWSCGVILYAMLAGYLPYDDDPKNPEGDNINLLYKYIMATPLSFPDYITAEPRDLLCKMLVPDPLKRADLDIVMAHPWLSPYRDLFRFSVEDLERAAIEQQNKKRMVYRQQMMMQQQMAEQQANGKAGRGNGANGDASVKQARHQSAVATSTTMADRIYESGLQSNSNARSRPFTGLPTPVAAIEPSTSLERDTPRASMDRNSMAPPPPPLVSAAKKSAAQKTQRHTIQLEYTAEAADKKREAEANRVASLNGDAIPPVPRKISRQEDVIMESVTSDVPPMSPTSEITKGLEAVHIPTTTAVLPNAERKTSISTSPSQAGVSSTRESRRNSTTPRVLSNPLPLAASPDVASNRVTSGGAGPHPEPRKSTRATRSSVTPSTPMTLSPSDQGAASEKAEKIAARQRKGMSTDKPFFARLMSSSTGSDSANNSSRPTSARKDELLATPDAKTEASSSDIGRKTSSNRRKAMSLVVGRYGDQSTPASKEREKAAAAQKAAKEERRLTGRSRKTTLTQDSSARFETPVKAATSTQKQHQQSPSAASVMTTNDSFRQSGRSSNNKNDGSTPFDQRFNESNTTVGPSSNAAKKVMDWFRKKSLSRGGFDEKSPLGPFDAEQSRNTPPRLVVTNDAGKEEGRAEKVATPAMESSPSSRSTSGTHSQTSQATDTTALTTATEDSLAGASSNGNKSSSSTVQQHTTPRASAAVASKSRAKIDESALRVHQGAVDQSALTSRPPNEVLEQVQMALFAMGIDVKKEKEEEYKFECLRKKRPKTLMGATQGLGLSIRTSVFPPSQAELERSSTGRIPASPSSLSPSHAMSTSPSSLRNFLRRNSSQHVASTSSASNETDAMPNPLYGEASVDGGQEVRFSVEVTKIKNLPGLYSLDIRRMKGNLWAYKFLYHALLDRCQLNTKAATSAV